MAEFQFQETSFKDVYLIKMFFAGDNRGSFTKSFEKDVFEMKGIKFKLNETFYSRSMKNVIRGLHFQKHKPQAKLVSVVTGRVWDVVVDLRPNSETYGKWESFELSLENHLSLFIPRGFAHGFACLEDNTIMLYQCDGKYDKKTDSGIIFNDPEINIEWPIKEDVAIHSMRDLELYTFREYSKNPMKV